MPGLVGMARQGRRKLSAIIAAMSCLQQLRQSRFLAPCVALWFALSLLAAMASPMVNPQAMQLICSGSGAMKVIVLTDDGAQEVTSTHTLDCPLCAALAAPPPALRFASELAQPLALAVSQIPAARIAALTAAPLPARGPPL